MEDKQIEIENWNKKILVLIKDIQEKYGYLPETKVLIMVLKSASKKIHEIQIKIAEGSDLAN